MLISLIEISCIPTMWSFMVIYVTITENKCVNSINIPLFRIFLVSFRLEEYIFSMLLLSNMHFSCLINGARSTQKKYIYNSASFQFIYWKFKVSPMHVLKAFWSYSSISWSSPSSLSLVFHKSCLLYQCSLQFLLLFYQVSSAKAIIHLLLTALAFTMKKAVTAESQ